MADNEFKRYLAEYLENRNINGNVEKANELGISYQKYKEYFIDKPEKSLTKTIAMRTINSIIQSNVKKAQQEIVQINHSELAKSIVASLTNAIGSDYTDYLKLPKKHKKELLEENFGSINDFMGSLFKSLVEYFYKIVDAEVDGLITNIYSFESIYPEKVEKTVWRIYKHPDGSEDPRIKVSLSFKKGIYLLYDSSGRLVYVGKTEKQDLYDEICQRLRTKVIPIILGNRRGKKLLGEVANYLTCYEVKNSRFIPIVESILIGMDPNTNSNIKLEKLEK